MKEAVVDIDKWSEAIEATDEEVDAWLVSILQTYDIEPNRDNIEMLELFAKHWIRKEFRKEGTEISEDELQKVYKIIVRVAYDVNVALNMFGRSADDRSTQHKNRR